MLKIQNCRFCGSKPIKDKLSTVKRDNTYRIRCVNELCPYPLSIVRASEESAIEAWNRKTNNQMSDIIQSAIDRDLKRLFKYICDDYDLKAMCQTCSSYKKNSHDYNECLNKPCFKFYRCYKYLDWILD